MTSGELTYFEVLDAVKRLPALERKKLLAEVSSLPLEPDVPGMSDAPEGPIVSDTNRVYSLEQLAHAFNAIGKPILKDDASLSFDPDDHPLR